MACQSTPLSKSQVSELAKTLDAAVEEFRVGRWTPARTGSSRLMR